MVYIRAKKLHGLKEYKYAGVDHSLVSRYILKPFYNNVAIKCFPMSMASVTPSFRPGALENCKQADLFSQPQCRKPLSPFRTNVQNP